MTSELTAPLFIVLWPDGTDAQYYSKLGDVADAIRDIPIEPWRVLQLIENGTYRDAEDDVRECIEEMEQDNYDDGEQVRAMSDPGRYV